MRGPPPQSCPVLHSDSGELFHVTKSRAFFISELPGKPDLVFRRRKRVIFVHGCFWHRHPDPSCKIARLPKSREEFWLVKLTRNRERDDAQIEALENMGWRVLTIWECQLKEASELKENIRRFLEAG